MTELERVSWKYSVAVAHKLLLNYKSAHHHRLKDHFQYTLGDLNEERGERFKEEIKTMKNTRQNHLKENCFMYTEK